MLRKISILPLVLACFLVVGHAIFPHTHQSQDYQASQTRLINLPLEGGFLNLLSKLFSQDLGNNHLEDYNQGSEDVPDLVCIAQAFLHTLLYFETDNGNASAFITPQFVPDLQARIIVKDTPLRAPPQA